MSIYIIYIYLYIIFLYIIIISAINKRRKCSLGKLREKTQKQ